jgi:hypothetical protein
MLKNSKCSIFFIIYLFFQFDPYFFIFFVDLFMKVLLFLNSPFHPSWLCILFVLIHLIFFFFLLMFLFFQFYSKIKILLFPFDLFFLTILTVILLIVIFLDFLSIFFELSFNVSFPRYWVSWFFFSCIVLSV